VCLRERERVGGTEKERERVAEELNCWVLAREVRV